MLQNDNNEENTDGLLCTFEHKDMHISLCK